MVWKVMLISNELDHLDWLVLVRYDIWFLQIILVITYVNEPTYCQGDGALPNVVLQNILDLLWNIWYLEKRGRSCTTMFVQMIRIMSGQVGQYFCKSSMRQPLPMIDLWEKMEVKSAKEDHLVMLVEGEHRDWKDGYNGLGGNWSRIIPQGRDGPLPDGQNWTEQAYSVLWKGPHAIG